MAQGAATGTLTGGNFGTPTTPIYLTFAYDVAAEYEVKLCTVAGTALTSCSHISGADVEHLANVKVGRMINTEVIDDIKNTDINGWVDPQQTWAYASATTITVPAGAASIYSVGDKLRFQNNNSGTYLYAYVITVADTLLTVVGNAVPNATLTDNYYSKVESPVGFPQWFDWTPTLSITGGGAVPTYTGNFRSRFSISGRKVTCQISWYNASGGTAGSGTTAIRVTFPVACSSTAYTEFNLGIHNIGTVFIYESGGTIALAFVWIYAASGLDGFAFSLGTAATVVGNDQSSDSRFITGTFTYEI